MKKLLVVLGLVLCLGTMTGCSFNDRLNVNAQHEGSENVMNVLTERAMEDVEEYIFETFGVYDFKVIYNLEGGDVNFDAFVLSEEGVYDDKLCSGWMTDDSLAVMC